MRGWKLGWWVLLVTIVAGCGDDAGGTADAGRDASGDSGPPPPSLELVFQSGFEMGTQIESRGEGNCVDDIRGLDESVPRLGDWEEDLEGGPLGRTRICYSGGTPMQRGVTLDEDPDNSSNRVLRTWIAAPNEVVSDDEVACGSVMDPESGADARGARKARFQLAHVDVSGVAEYSYEVRVRLGAGFQRLVDAYPNAVNWMTIGEFWNVQENGDRARVTLNIVRDDAPGSAFRFGLKSDLQREGESGWQHLVMQQVSEMEVPIEGWFTMQLRIRAGDADEGRMQLRVASDGGEMRNVFDVAGPTQVPGGVTRGFTALHPLKLYTNGNLVCWLRAEGLELSAMWDDFSVRVSTL